MGSPKKLTHQNPGRRKGESLMLVLPMEEERKEGK